jgi:transcriptional regulator with XRE-family HTH domain
MAKDPITWGEGSRLVQELGREDHLARRLRTEREKRGWSQERLAREMTKAGCPVPQSAVSKIEKSAGRRAISVDEGIALSKVFELPLDELLLPQDALRDVQMLRDVARGPVVAREAYLADLEYRELVARVANRARGSEEWRRELVKAATVRDQLLDPDSLAGQFYRDVLQAIGEDVS